jgi:aryl-alcohol dehydrogenase-like predicted oxidoreductase
MHYRKLGKSTLEVSEIGFGCMSLRGDETSDIRLILKAIDGGINFFDTADLYDHGRNEILVGKALHEKRKQVILATKVGNQWKKDGSGWDWNPRKDYILACIDESLRRLNTDYIDLYQLHGGTIEDPIDETIGNSFGDDAIWLA